MSDDISYFSYFRARWRPLVAAALIAAFFIGLPAFWVTSFSSPEYSVHVLWPARMSADAPAKLPISLSRWDADVDLNGSATLYYGWAPDSSEYARAVDDGELEEIASGTLDTHGTAVLDIPEAPQLPELTENDYRSPVLVLRTDVDGFERWFQHSLEQVDAPVLALTLDRPLYQPGQTMHIRGLVASATTGKPLDTKARFVVRDAKSNLVMDEEVETGPNGVAATELALADRCLQGSYTVELSAMGESTQDNVDVRPFRLPRFKVVVTPASAEVRPGEKLEVRVVATYTYGEPVAGAQAAVTASIGNLPLPDQTGVTDGDGGFDVSWDVPKNAPAGVHVQLRGTVTSLAGRAEVGAATTSIAGRRAVVELVPATAASFVFGQSQRAFVLVRDGGGALLSGAKVELIMPESAGERTETVTTDAKGRAAFDWTPDSGRGSYVSVTVVSDGAVVFKENVHVNVTHGQSSLAVDRSIADVGGTVKVQPTASPSSGTIALVRDGVTVSTAAVPSQSTSVELAIPADAAGFVTVALVRHGNVERQAPLWVRQKGGDRVEISLDPAEVRPGSQTKVQLNFTAPEGESEGGVTFGLVGVDEALYALKERAGVPLYVLMRRAPATIFEALAAFDGIDRDDGDSVAIATHRFRASTSHETSLSIGSNEVTRNFVKYARALRLRIWAWLCLIGLIALVVQLGRWTWRATSKSAFSWRRLGAQAAFSIFCGIFAIALASASGDTLGGGITVWMAVVFCWLIAAAVRLPQLRFDAWLLGHVIAIALSVSIAICSSDLRSSDLVVVHFGMVLPLGLAAIQWLVWAFVLMREGMTKPGLGIGSFAGVGILGFLGAGVMTVGMAAKDQAMPMRAMVGDMAEMEPMAPPAVQSPMPEAVEAKKSMLLDPNNQPDVAAGGPGMAVAPRVRSWFPETMIWLPQIAGDGSGQASVDLEVPDSITTWRLDAWANTADGRFGQGQAKLLAVQPYFVELDVPFEVIDGDRFDVPVTLVNRSDGPLNVDLSADTEGPIVLRGARGGSPRLEAGARTTMWLSVAAVGVGSASITVSSTTDGGEGDAVQRSLAVKPDGRVLRKSASAIIGKGWETGVNVPPDTIENTRFGEVRLFASLVADALAGLNAMLAFPAGCFEQTSSANYPNVMILRAMRDMKPEDWPDGAEDFQKTHKRASRYVNLGYQKILTFQHSDGGFALYPDSKHYKSDIMLTAYGILQLVWASDVTDVDPAVIARAANWLASQQNENGSFAPRHGLSGTSSHDTDIGLVRATSFVVMALAATKNANYRPQIDRALVQLEKRMPSVESANALAYLANALADAGSKELAKKAADQLAAMATREGQVAFWADSHPTWMGGWGHYSSLETTALAAQALLATESQAELLQPTLTWIANSRGGYGGWGSTQATVWTLRALETLRSKGNNDATVRFYFESQQLETLKGAKDLQVTKAPQPLRQFSFVPTSNEGRFLVDSSAETAAMVQLVTEYAVDWDSRFADVDGEPFGGELEIADRASRRGATTRAYARIENLLETDARMVIIEAPLPPGAFVPDDALNDLVANGAIDMYEILPTHIRFYVNAVAAKTERVFAYDFVPLVRGTFSLPPLRAYPYYSPEPITEVDAGDIRTQ